MCEETWPFLSFFERETRERPEELTLRSEIMREPGFCIYYYTLIKDRS